MKKITIMAALAVTTLSATAVDLGVRGTVSSADNMAESVGVTLGQKFGKMGAEVGFDRTTRGPVNVNKWSAVGSYDLVKLGPVGFAAKGGVYLVDASVGANGSGLVAGVGATFALNKQVKLTADYVYQTGANRVSFADGNYFAFGAKYSF